MFVTHRYQGTCSLIVALRRVTLKSVFDTSAPRIQSVFLRDIVVHFGTDVGGDVHRLYIESNHVLMHYFTRHREIDHITLLGRN